MTCDAKIRPFVNDLEAQCELPAAHAQMHETIIRDYAYPGSETRLRWADDDRRTFRGAWSPCPEICILPDGHQGRHAP
jgi:hypothetical protein